MSLSHTQLRRWYLQYNRKWFSDRLPRDMDVMYVPDDLNHGTAIVDCCDNCVIKIDTAIAGTRFARLTLIHEMNHHDTGDFGHGPKFQLGMVNLAMRGAFKNIW